MLLAPQDPPAIASHVDGSTSSLTTTILPESTLTPVLSTMTIMTNLKTIHTTIVRDHLWDRPHNKILSRQAPDVDQDEETLPRLTRRRLAQLSTNKPPFLRQYLHKIDIITHPTDECPLCGALPHDTPRLFDSTELPTDLTTDDLWTNFLGDVWSAGCVGRDGPVPDGRIGARGMLTAGWVSTQQQQRQH